MPLWAVDILVPDGLTWVDEARDAAPNTTNAHTKTSHHCSNSIVSDDPVHARMLVLVGIPLESCMRGFLMRAKRKKEKKTPPRGHHKIQLEGATIAPGAMLSMHESAGNRMVKAGLK